ncbi:amylo-alpha-1,6-glucosidase [Candidatus Nanohalococcus occultus]|uniref:amylo-alpha-1,6-glucosidase n=1 Tax=Candidatus Nanohalococcus occultus TaxID=2978047 RepID=UPI0039E0FE2C
MKFFDPGSGLENLSGTISDLDCFIHRSLDTGFKTKWSGFWIPPYKYLDYYALKVNGSWLNSENLIETGYGQNLIYRYRTSSLKITERIEFLDDAVGFRCQIKVENMTDDPKAVRTSLEAGIDIREKSKDIGSDEYSLENEENVEVSKNGRKLVLTGGKLEGKAYIKDHYPGESQRCFVPGEFVKNTEVEPRETESFSFEIKTGDESHGRLEKTSINYNGPMKELYQESVRSMENLIYERNGKGIIAGHPWFQSYWARDTFWTVLGLIDAGRYDLSRQILENFAEKNLPGKISLDSGSEEFPREDTYPLFVIAAEKLREADEASELIENRCNAAMEMLKLENGIVVHDEEGTWMDTLKRSPAVDIQSLWLEAARLRDDSRAKDLEKGLEKFLDEKMVKDSPEDGSPQAVNFAVPLMFGHIDAERAEKYLSRLNGEFTSKYGARTRSMADPGYESGGYHTGSVWGLTTCWAAAANARYGNERQALNYLERFSQFLDRDQPGALPEVVDAESGDLLGCPEQAWSAGMTFHVLKSFIDSDIGDTS